MKKALITGITGQDGSYLNNIEGISFQNDQPNSLNVCWVNAILVDEKKYGKTKNSLMEYLKNNDVDTRLLFTGMHKQKCLKKYGCDIDGAVIL